MRTTVLPAMVTRFRAYFRRCFHSTGTVGWHPEARQPRKTTTCTYTSDPVLVDPDPLNVQRLPYGYTHCSVRFYRTYLHASTSHWPVSFVCPCRFIPIPDTHIRPSFRTFTDPSQATKPVGPDKLVCRALSAQILPSFWFLLP